VIKRAERFPTIQQNQKPKMITVHTANTPNGVKIPIVLEELDVPYAIHRIDLSANEQKKAAFLAINPNGRIPAIVDQAGWFMRQDEKVPMAIARYQTESGRLTEVSEARLSAQPWLAGDEYSIADIANFGWLRVASYAGVDLADYPSVQRWVQLIEARPAVQRALVAMA
jgi:GST-like protein